ncbi:MAG TPA: TRAP transporter small permease subunit [Pseudorhodoplanes sp.]|nr:TRAP transporter small permease subunit [Pseudorhodoplanes sp.]
MIASVTRLARLVTVAAGFALLATAILVSVEVIVRRFFLISLNAGSEISSYVLGIVASWGLSYTLLLRGHVRVDALVRHFPERVRLWIDLFALLGLGLVAVLLLIQGFVTFLASWSMDAHSMTPLQIPIWIPQGLWVLGLAFFVFVLGMLAVFAGMALLRGDYRKSQQLIGIQGVEDEAAEALADVRAITEAEGARQ